MGLEHKVKSAVVFLYLGLLVGVIISAPLYLIAYGESNPITLNVVMVENDYLREDYELDVLRDTVLRMVDGGDDCAPSVLGDPIRVYDSSDLWDVVYARIYEYKDAILVVTDLGYYYFVYNASPRTTSYSRVVSDPITIFEKVYRDYLENNGINVSIGEPVSIPGDTERYPIYIEGIRTVYNITVQGSTHECIKATKLEGWIPIRPTITRLIVTAYNGTIVEDVVLVPYGNISLGVKLYPYVTLQSNNTEHKILILSSDDYKEITLEETYWPDFNYIIDTGSKANTIKNIFLAVAGIVFATIIVAAIILRIRKRKKRKQEPSQMSPLIMPRDY